MSEYIHNHTRGNFQFNLNFIFVKMTETMVSKKSNMTSKPQ